MLNSLGNLPVIPYKIIEYLALSELPEADYFWKMMRYPEYDALKHSSLSFSEKMDIIWRTGPQEKCGIFLTNLIEDSVAESKCILKCYNYYIHPTDMYISSVVYAFDFLYGGEMSLVEYNGIPVNRGDLFTHCLLSILNGAYVGGVGKMMFLNDLSRYTGAKSVVGNSKTFTGVCVYLATMIGDTGLGDVCGAQT